MRPHNVWVRVLYLQPEGMTDELIETIRDTPEVLPYIDIPVQHCDARILKAMRRSGSRQELEDLFRDLRERIPGIVIRSTAMVGFPTETDDEFRDLIDFMDTVGFDYTSVFAYSQEEGSLAAKMEARSTKRSSSSAPGGHGPGRVARFCRHRRTCGERAQ